MSDMQFLTTAGHAHAYAQICTTSSLGIFTLDHFAHDMLSLDCLVSADRIAALSWHSKMARTVALEA